MTESVSPEVIYKYFNLGLLGLFIAAIAVFLIGFIRGLFQGWKYGTYRFAFYTLLIVGAAFAMQPLLNALLNMNLSGFFAEPISFAVETSEGTVQIISRVTTLKQTGVNIISQLFQAWNIAVDPTTVGEYAIAITTSIVCLLSLVIEAILILLVGNLFCVILWNAFFKHLFKATKPSKEKAKKIKKTKKINKLKAKLQNNNEEVEEEEKKKKFRFPTRLISGFEQAIISTVIFAMFISPLTGMLNTLNRSFERIPKGEETSNKVVVDSEVYQTITGLLDTYDDSVFNKVFFSWYANGETDMKFDEALLTYLSTVDLPTGDRFSIMSEISNVVKAASYAVNGGLIGSDGITSQTIALFATSEYAPKVLRTLGQSSLIQSIAPAALEVVLNMDAVADYLLTAEGIDLSHYDNAATFNKLADLYETILSSNIMDEVVDDTTGEFVFDADHLSNVFSPNYQRVFDSVFDTLSSDELSFLNDFISSALYVQAVKEYKQAEEAPEGSIVIGAKDFLPELTSEELKCTAQGRPIAIPQSIKSINYVDEVKTIFDVVYNLIGIDDDFLPLILDPLLGGEESSGFGQDTINGIIGIVLNNVNDVEKYIDGNGLSSGDKCLLDSCLIANAIPAFLNVLELSTNDLIGLEGDERISVQSIITDYKSKDLQGKTEAAKTESKNLFNVLKPFVTSEEGKALISDFENLPGLYFDKSGSFLGAKEGLLTSLAQGLSLIDNSKIFSNLLPTVLQKYLGGDDGLLKQSLNLDLTLDFAPVDSTGKSILGHEIANIIRTFAECQDSITYLMGALGSASDMKALEKAFTGVCGFKTSSNELQLTALLTAIGQSKIFNPVVKEGGTTTYNTSVYQIFKMIFETTGFLDADMDNDLKDIIMVESFDVSSEINGLVNLIKYLCENKILGSFSGGLSIDTLASINFEGLFSTVASSELLQTILGDIIDSKLGSIALFSYVNESGDTVNLSFHNITDWQREGAALDTMTKYASLVGDISAISIDSLEPEMLSAIVGYLASSQLFVEANEDGTYNWLFPSYFASKAVKLAKGAGQIGQFLVDLEETYEGGVYEVKGKDPSLDESYSAVKAEILAYDIKNTSDLSLITDGQQTFVEEGQKLSEIVRCLMSSSALNIMSDGVNANYSNFKVPYFDELMDNMAESVLMGRTGITQILATVSNMLKGSVEAFGYTNVMYAYQTNSVAERKAIGDAIVTIIERSIDPITGFLGSDSKIDFTKFSNMAELDAIHFVSPVLHALNSTEAFTTLSTFQQTTAGMTKSTFLGEMKVVLQNASWYGSDEAIEAMLPIIDANVTANGGWDLEIEKFTTVMDDFNSMGLEMTGGFTFDGLFNEEKYGEDVVSRILLEINDSELLYPGLPAKIESAITSLQSGSLASSGMSLANANPYYNGKSTVGTTTYATHPYYEEDCYKLASILGKSSMLGSLDLSDLSTLSSDDIENVTCLLADFAQSGIFNTLKDGASTSTFQDVMGVVLGGDSLKDFYISSSSPKDVANSTHYANAVEKAKYYANVEYPYISNTNSNADVTNLKDPTDPSSLRSFLTLLTSDSDYTSALSSGSFDSLNETKMGLLLDALNKCDWTYDIVPNVIADSIKNQTLDSVELKRSNPFYEYNYQITLTGGSYENQGTLLGTPNYANRYDDNEIELVAKVVTVVKSDSTLTTDLSSKTKVLKLRNFLETLNDSYSFHLAGASYALKADDNLSEFTLTDLPVFEQAMYSVYKQSGLASLAYNNVYDGEYANAEAKLLDKIKDYPDSSWTEELVNLMINDTMDKGLLCTAFDLGFVSGGNVSISSSEILSKNPTELSQILYAANKVDISQELVAYEIQKTIQDTINFKTFSEETATYPVNASSYSINLDNAVYRLEITMTSGVAPTVSYQKAGTTAYATPTGSNPYVYTLYNGTTVLDRPLGKDIAISGTGTISSVKVTFTSDKEIGLTQDEYDVEVAGNHVGAINELITIANDCFYKTDTNTYIDFATDTNALATIFGTPGNVTKLLRFMKSPNSYFTASFDSSFNNGTEFDAGDITISRLIAFNYSGYSVDLFEYMPDYNVSNRIPGYKNLNAITSNGTLATVASWLDGHILEAAGFYGAYKALPNIQAVASGVPTFAYNGENITAYLYNEAEWNTFESAFKMGFSRKMYVDMRNAAMASAHFAGNITSATLYEPSASDFQGFISLTRSSLIPLMKDLNLSGLTNKTIAATRLDNLANVAVDSPYKDVISSYYEKVIYEALVANMSGSFASQPLTHSAPFGGSGYLRNAAVILEPSLA